MSDFILFFFFFKQKTAYEMRISDWSSDVCSSDLLKSLNDHSGLDRLSEANFVSKNEARRSIKENAARGIDLMPEGEYARSKHCRKSARRGAPPRVDVCH